MPFIPHTEADVRAMLATIGVTDLDALFAEIPAGLERGGADTLPSPLNEMALRRLMTERAAREGSTLCFVGAGAYAHHIPAAVWEIATRGEFYSAYTPYQAEASQGTLQTLYEYQTMIAALTGMEASNASLYDGASALGEAILMAVRAHPDGARRVLLPTTVHPRYRAVARTLTRAQGIELVELPFTAGGGHIDPQTPHAQATEAVAAVVIQHPNFFGTLEEVDALTDWAHARGALVIAVVNPATLGVLVPPGDWGEKGADIACGDGQPLGIPLAGGGPYFGFLCCKTPLLRQMPGRIVGRTTDREGKEGFVLTLQAREQHIRRARATSNICSNQGLMTIAATIHMALLGPEGLRRVGLACHANLVRLLARLATIPGVRVLFDRPRFHEAVLLLPRPVTEVVTILAREGIAAGYPLATDYPALGEALLVCTTERHGAQEIDHFAAQLHKALGV
ncbi:MAG: aminomethyl-transferring glycine dehydrogenase subunit GcvPA [Magnetococcales bacterium]|nr:aminomethyl-transferring glycine dehydrogenase subunit GcvPA [Magnetococcales bacterium]